jgi:hypothetical protein
MRNNCGDANKDHRECLHLPSAFVTMRRLSLVCAGTFGAALGHVTLANRRWTVARTQIYCTICTETQLTENYFEWVPHARRVLRRERESVVYFLLFLQAHRETTAHLVVVTGPFINFLLHNHSVIYKILIFFFRQSKRQRNFSLFYFASEES